jgi:ribonucleotide monophosphatase NagD (HAD superfamily)
MVRNGAEYLSTHPDFNCPTEDGFIPDSGAIAAFVTASTGVEPTYFGKPYVQTVEMISEYTGVSREEMCVFGDRLYTDIAIGKKSGVTAVLVLTGETKIKDTLGLSESEMPDVILDDAEKLEKEIFGN